MEAKDALTRRAFMGRTATLFAGLPLGVMLASTSYGQDKEKEEGKDKGKQKGTPLFNGKDLTGWKAEGGAVWEVKDGILIGKQGPKFAPGDLFTTEEFGDFRLLVEYKIQWPANSGVWFRYQSPEKSYQADILEYKNPVAYSGTIYCPGKMFLAANTDPAIEKKDDWNVMKIRAEGDHLVVKLNDKVTADVHDSSYAKGRIGFQIHPGEEFKDMVVSLRKIVIRPITAEKK